MFFVVAPDGTMEDSVPWRRSYPSPEATPQATSRADDRPGLDCSLKMFTDWRHRQSHFPMSIAADWRMDPPPTLRERAMLQFMANVTDQPGWETAVFDEDKVLQYSYYRHFLAVERSFDFTCSLEALRSAYAGAESYTTEVGFSDEMFHWCIWELGMKAQFSRANHGIVSMFDISAAVFKQTLPEAFRITVAEALAPLEHEASADKANHWQPLHNETNLKIVQPSLYALDFARTHVVRDRVVTLDNCFDSIGCGQPIGKQREQDTYMATINGMSARFQWLPTDVALDADGNSHLTGYINNIHPVKHADVYRMVEQLLDKALPLFAAAYDSVTTEHGVHASKFRKMGARFKTDFWRCTTPQLCASPRARVNRHPRSYGCKAANYLLEKDDATVWEQDDWFLKTHPLPQPEPLSDPANLEAFSSSRRPLPTRLPWVGRSLQIIVSVGNILLTPDKPEYTTGSFHVEGLLNERICASAIYYYDSDNITESRLGFQAPGLNTAIYQNDYSNPDRRHVDRPLARELYGVTTGDYGCGPSPWMKLGSVQTLPGRLVVFPNVYGHRVEPFELVDKTRPGYRKMIAIFLVDPGTPIISTANVPPQQSHWATREQRDPNSPEMLSGAIIGPETAKQRSDALLANRTGLATEQFGNEFQD